MLLCSIFSILVSVSTYFKISVIYNSGYCAVSTMFDKRRVTFRKGVLRDLLYIIQDI